MLSCLWNDAYKRTLKQSFNQILCKLGMLPQYNISKQWYNINFACTQMGSSEYQNTGGKIYVALVQDG